MDKTQDKDPAPQEDSTSQAETAAFADAADADTVETVEASQDDMTVCKSCGGGPVVEGYTIPLCEECRRRYANNPVPGWIKVFATIVLAVMTYSLVSFPKSLEGGIAYERGIRAESQHRYITAANQYMKVVDAFPNSFVGWGKLFIARVKNNQLAEAEAAFEMIQGKGSSNEEEIRIIDEANEAIKTIDLYYNVSEELQTVLSKRPEPGAQVDSFLNEVSVYASQNPDDYWAQYVLGDILFEQGQYEEAKAAYLSAVRMCPQIDEFHLNAAAAYRQTGDFDEALKECNIVLSGNNELPGAHASLAKIYLKQHKYDEALKIARKAFDLDNGSANTVGTLALAYHFKGMSAEMNKTLDLLKGLDQGSYDSVREIVEGKSKLYD